MIQFDGIYRYNKSADNFFSSHSFDIFYWILNIKA